MGTRRGFQLGAPVEEPAHGDDLVVADGAHVPRRCVRMDGRRQGRQRGNCCRLVVPSYHGSTGEVAEALVAVGHHDRRGPHPVEEGQEVDDPQEVPHSAVEEPHRSAVGPGDAQAECSLARGATPVQGLEGQVVPEDGGEHHDNGNGARVSAVHAPECQEERDDGKTPDEDVDGRGHESRTETGQREIEVDPLRCGDAETLLERHVTVDGFIGERRSTWAELDGLVDAAGRRPDRLPPADVLRLGALYRGAAADLALARQRFGSEPFVARLEDLVGRARTLVYSSEPRRLSVGEFVTTGYWRRIRERPLMLVIAVLLLVVPAGLSMMWATREPVAASGLAPAEYQSVTTPRETGQDQGIPADEQARISGEILTNNIRVTILAFAGGILFAVPAAMLLIYNAVLLGTVFGMALWAGNGQVAVELIAPHGVLELSCMVVSAVAGMRIGWALVDPGHRRRVDALTQEARPAVELMLGTAALLVIAGLVEGFVTGSGLSLGEALAVGLGLGGAFWGLVIWRGRPADRPMKSRRGTGQAIRPTTT